MHECQVWFLEAGISPVHTVSPTEHSCKACTAACSPDWKTLTSSDGGLGTKATAPARSLLASLRGSLGWSEASGSRRGPQVQADGAAEKPLLWAVVETGRRPLFSSPLPLPSSGQAPKTQSESGNPVAFFFFSWAPVPGKGAGTGLAEQSR